MLLVLWKIVSCPHACAEWSEQEKRVLFLKTLQSESDASSEPSKKVQSKVHTASPLLQAATSPSSSTPSAASKISPTPSPSSSWVSAVPAASHSAISRISVAPASSPTYLKASRSPVSQPSSSPWNPPQTLTRQVPSMTHDADRKLENESTPARTPQAAAIVIEKSGKLADEGLIPPPTEHRKGWWFWRKESGAVYVTRAVKQGIDRANVKRNRWKYIVIHNSGTRAGNAKIFDRYHRNVRKMPNGLAYHFVIGNGSGSQNGAIEIGSRWARQINGGHVASDYLNNIALGICLVGDFNRNHPTQAQLASLKELIAYLKKRCGKCQGKTLIVRGHKEINPKPTDCPGNRFPLQWLRQC